MIFDQLQSAGLYRGLDPRLSRGLELLADGQICQRAEGRYELDGPRLVAIVQQYMTKPLAQAAFETHQRYTDIQYVVSGSELMGYGPVAEMTVREAYNPQRDVAFHDGTGRGFVRADAGTFAIFYPHEAHAPSLAVDQPALVRKVVLKVALG